MVTCVHIQSHTPKLYHNCYMELQHWRLSYCMHMYTATKHSPLFHCVSVVPHSVVFAYILVLAQWATNNIFCMSVAVTNKFYFRSVCLMTSVLNNKRQIRGIPFVKTDKESTRNTGMYKVYNQVYFHLYPRSVHILRSISHKHYTIAMSEEWSMFRAFSSSRWMALS